MGSTSPGHTSGAHGKVNATCLLLSSASHHWPWTPTALAALPLCGVVSGGSLQDHPEVPPCLSSDSSRPEWSHHAQSQECWKQPQHPPSCKPRHAQCQTRAAHLTPSSQCPPQAGDCPKPPVPPGFDHSHQRGGTSPQQLHLVCCWVHHQNPNSHPTTNIWRGGGSWMWVCFASQPPARHSQHGLG